MAAEPTPANVATDVIMITDSKIDRICFLFVIVVDFDHA
jgi:hypothetical protein